MLDAKSGPAPLFFFRVNGVMENKIKLNKQSNSGWDKVGGIVRCEK
jgi:hypothetical protein